MASDLEARAPTSRGRDDGAARLARNWELRVVDVRKAFSIARFLSLLRSFA